MDDWSTTQKVSFRKHTRGRCYLYAACDNTNDSCDYCHDNISTLTFTFTNEERPPAQSPPSVGPLSGLTLLCRLFSGHSIFFPKWTSFCPPVQLSVQSPEHKRGTTTRTRRKCKTLHLVTEPVQQVRIALRGRDARPRHSSRLVELHGRRRAQKKITRFTELPFYVTWILETCEEAKNCHSVGLQQARTSKDKWVIPKETWRCRCPGTQTQTFTCIRTSNISSNTDVFSYLVVRTGWMCTLGLQICFSYIVYEILTSRIYFIPE